MKNNKTFKEIHEIQIPKNHRRVYNSWIVNKQAESIQHVYFVLWHLQKSNCFWRITHVCISATTFWWDVQMPDAARLRLFLWVQRRPHVLMLRTHWLLFQLCVWFVFHVSPRRIALHRHDWNAPLRDHQLNGQLIKVFSCQPSPSCWKHFPRQSH